MQLGWTFKRCYILILVMSCFSCALMSCSKSPIFSNSRGEGTVDDKAATSSETLVTDEELAAIVHDFQKQADASGNILSLPGYRPGQVLQDHGNLTLEDIAASPDEKLFSFDLPLHVGLEYSRPTKISANSSGSFDAAAECGHRDFFSEAPSLKDVPVAGGFYVTCIRLTNPGSKKVFYIKTPPVEFLTAKIALKLRSDDCIDPSLSLVMSGVEVTMCDGSLGIGTYLPPALPPECTQDGQLGCVTTLALKPVAMSNFTAADVKAGTTVAGVAGTLANCTADGTRDCVATETHKAVQMANFEAADIRSGIEIAGIVGSATAFPATCASDGETGCVAVPAYKAAKMTNFDSTKILTGTTVAGVVGSATPAPADCGTDGATGCVAIATYKAAKMADFDATKILTGTTVAGVVGAATPAPADCGTDGATGCVAIATYKAARIANFDASKIRSGTTIAGVAGTVANCSSNGQDTCFLDSTSSYDAADLTNLSAGNIKNAVVIAGVTGQYPSASYPLPGASGGVADLAAPIDAQVKNAATFEFWDSEGSRYTDDGDADITAAKIKASVDIFGAVGTVADAASINAWDLRVGVTVGSTTGALKVNCRNAVNPATFDSDTMPPGNVATTAGTTNDWWDTIEDYNNNLNTVPSALVSGWTSDTQCDASNWQDVTNDGSGDTICDEAADHCVFKDQISGLQWSEHQSAASTWSAAVNVCNSLNTSNFGGYNSGWRLPTQKELVEAYIHGIRDVGYKGGTAATSSNNDDFIPDTDSYFWSATTGSALTTTAWNVSIYNGDANNDSKGDANEVLCVR